MILRRIQFYIYNYNYIVLKSIKYPTKMRSDREQRIKQNRQKGQTMKKSLLQNWEIPQKLNGSVRLQSIIDRACKNHFASNSRIPSHNFQWMNYQKIFEEFAACDINLLWILKYQHQQIKQLNKQNKQLYEQNQQLYQKNDILAHQNQLIFERLKIIEQKLSVNKYQNQGLCKVCLEKPAKFSNMCGHVCVCEEHAKILKKCPLCNREGEFIEIFSSHIKG